jgi:hypothetical protein
VKLVNSSGSDIGIAIDTDVYDSSHTSHSKCRYC